MYNMCSCDTEKMCTFTTTQRQNYHINYILQSLRTYIFCFTEYWLLWRGAYGLSVLTRVLRGGNSVVLCTLILKTTVF